MNQTLADVSETGAVGHLEWAVLVRSVPQDVVREMDRRLDWVELAVASVVDVIEEVERGTIGTCLTGVSGVSVRSLGERRAHDHQQEQRAANSRSVARDATSTGSALRARTRRSAMQHERTPTSVPTTLASP